MFGRSDQEDPRHGNAQQASRRSNPHQTGFRSLDHVSTQFRAGVADVRAGRGIHSRLGGW